MESLWTERESSNYGTCLLGQRVYSSRLLGRNPELVLHGGGNTSVKIAGKDFFGQPVDLLYVKGSGWDLATIEREGFAPVRMEALLRMADLPAMTDEDMVLQQRAAMINPNAPTPSIEAILHAILPFRYVDHTHANAISALTCNKEGEMRVRAVYGQRVLIVPYVMPGFVLAKTVYDLIRGRDLRKEGIDGMILLKHGIFTFHDDARASYELMIELVSMAEEYLREKAGDPWQAEGAADEDLRGLATLRNAVCKARGTAMLARLDASPKAVGYASRTDNGAAATRGPLTPDHSIRTKRAPAHIAGGDIGASISQYTEGYRDYFKRHARGQTMLDPAPRFVLWPGHGIVSFGVTEADAGVVADIAAHTAATVQLGEAVGGWEPLPEKDIFEIEYWELEQAKLRKGPAARVHQGKVAIVTGSEGGIGFACAESLARDGAKVIGMDLNPNIAAQMESIGGVGMVLNLTDDAILQESIAEVVRRFGGIDIVVSNAGIFTAGQYIEDLDASNWDKAMAVNLTSHQKLLKYTIPFLKQGIDSAIILVGSRNVKAPGPGAASYSCSKAALTQLCRVAALELAPSRVRCNVIHPDAVFDTKIWTPEVLARSAERYGMTVEEYKTKNLMKVEIKSRDIGNMVSAMAGPLFAKTTGAQVPVDGGNDRVI